MNAHRRYYWWIYGRDDGDGKPFLVFGSDKSEDDARMKGFDMLSGVEFDIKRLPTRDVSSASRMIKGHKLEVSHDLRKSTRRLSHKPSRSKRQHSATMGVFYDGGL